MNSPQHASVHEFEVKAIDGETVSLRQYEGKVLLIVNVASECGFTPQYQGLEELYRRFRERGFAVLGFPCNQFGNQEPGDEAQIKNFCETRFQVSFPLFSKIDVNGPGAHPLYEFMKERRKGLLGSEAIKWNFTKFLIDRQGEVVGRFPPQAKPAELASEIEKFLRG
ncbi:MAG: glutathione peroxidase [Oligoflexia bacterium]|nr:glutathione peroxidase [Oligoflexia bacterium]